MLCAREIKKKCGHGCLLENRALVVLPTKGTCVQASGSVRRLGKAWQLGSSELEVWEPATELNRPGCTELLPSSSSHSLWQYSSFTAWQCSLFVEEDSAWWRWSPSNHSCIYIKADSWACTLPADRFRSRSQPWWVAVREGAVAEQRADCRTTEHTQSIQLCPPALDQVFLHVLWIWEGGVEENQQIVLQDGAAHISTIRTAVACNAFVESVGRGYT